MGFVWSPPTPPKPQPPPDIPVARLRAPKDYEPLTCPPFLWERVVELGSWCLLSRGWAVPVPQAFWRENALQLHTTTPRATRCGFKGILSCKPKPPRAVCPDRTRGGGVGSAWCKVTPIVCVTKGNAMHAVRTQCTRSAKF